MFTQEFKFTSPASSASPLKWTARSYLFYQNSPTKLATHFGKDAALLGSPDVNYSLINTTKGKGYGVAFYGQGTYSLSDKLDVIAGARYDYEHKKQNIAGDYQKDLNSMPLFAYQNDTSAVASFSAFTPKLGLNYHASKNSILFATYSKGYRAGGLTPLSSDPSQPALFAFKPEYSNNFEAGVKNSFFNNQLLLNGTLFYSTVTNAQVPTLVLPSAVTITKNTGKLESKGIEAELYTTPVKGLEINYSVGYTDAKYQDLKLSQNGAEVNLKGNHQLFTPDFSSMLAIQYRHSLKGKQDLNLVIRSEWKYLGTQYFDLANTISQSSYSLLNTRIGVAARNFSIMLWGRNLGDKKYISYAYDFGAVHLADPRTYGVTIGVLLAKKSE